MRENPPQSILREGECTPTQTDWMTMGRIAAYVGKTYDWVQPRLEQYREFSERKPDARNHLRPNFPGWVIDILKQEAEAISDYPVVGSNDIPKHGVARLLQRDQKWIDARLPFLGIQATTKLNPVQKRLFEYFDREKDVPLLKIESDRMREYPIADKDESTVEGLAKILGVTRRVIVFRLKFLPLIPTLKVNPQVRQIYPYYHTQQTIELLRDVEQYGVSPKGRHPSLVPPKDPSLDIPVSPIDRRGVDSEPVSSYGVPIGQKVVVNAENWTEYAECAQSDPNFFNDARDRLKVAIAKKACNVCVSRLYCLDYAVVNNEEEGVWGGLTPAERKNLKME